MVALKNTGWNLQEIQVQLDKSKSRRSAPKLGRLECLHCFTRGKLEGSFGLSSLRKANSSAFL